MLAAVAVGAGDGAHLRCIVAARDELCGCLFDGGESAKFGAGALDEGLEIEVRDGVGEVEAQERVIGIRSEIGIDGFAGGNGAGAQALRNRSEIVVIEEVNFRAKVVKFMVDRVDEEAAATTSDDVETAIRIALCNALDKDGATGVDDALLFGEDDAEFGSGRFSFAYHSAIAVFENVERNGDSGQRHQLQRKQRQKVFHNAIIAFPCCAGVARKSMDIKLKRTPAIYLTGFMGCGKTTIGHLLADHLGWEFVDIDAGIEKAEGTTIAAIFETRGEPEFRRLETAAIRDVIRRVERGTPVVVALGGGAFVQEDNYEMVIHRGLSIWLDCRFDTVEHRVAGEAGTRPLARDTSILRQLYDTRRASYGRADHRVAADGDSSEVLAAILDLPIWK